MMQRLLTVTTLACACQIGLLFADDNSEGDQGTFSERILTLTDVVLEKHIDPPARQAMILAGVKALYHADKQLVPKGISQEVSELSSREEFASYLDGIRNEFRQLAGREAILTNGMLTAVPGSAFLIDAKISAVQQQVNTNKYVGTGIALAVNRDEKLTQITKVFYDGPAWKAGIKDQDLIVGVNGESTESKNITQVVESLRGEAGSEVTIEVRQPNSEETRTLTVTRGRVFIPTIEGAQQAESGQWEFTIDSAQDIALLRVKNIGPSTLHELRKVAAALGADVRGIILGVRAGGGILHDIVMVADSMLDSGKIGHVRSWESSIEHDARPGDLFQGLPIAVLVARNTSAGNVFLTAALQDNKRATVIGEPTTGETYVAAFVPIPGRSEKLRLPTGIMSRGDGTPLLRSRFARPVALEVAKAGAAATKKQRPAFIVPDHIVHVAPQRHESHEGHVNDPILSNAIEVLREAAAVRGSEAANETTSG